MNQATESEKRAEYDRIRLAITANQTVLDHDKIIRE